MRILFPAASDRVVDSSFRDEMFAARAAGFKTGLVGVETYFGGDVWLRNVEPGAILYRGWILKEADYVRLDAAIKSRSGTLTPSLADYQYQLDFPRWYQDLSETPRSFAFREADMDRLGLRRITDQMSVVFGHGMGKAAILKDFLKSRKHDWRDACFVPDATDHEDLFRVASNLVQRQREDGTFVGGIVFREYIPLKHIGFHPKSKMPLVNEWRIFLWDRKPFYRAPYWLDGANYEGQEAPPSDIEHLARNIKSRFVALDVAQREDGGWSAIEVNDGGSAGIPEGGNAEAFYTALRQVAQ